MAIFFCAMFFASHAIANSLMMATTTSTDNTGFLDYIAPFFENQTGIILKWTATGTGKALKLGQSCDVDVLFVHAPKAEKKYIENGYGKNKRQVMYNDFVIIGHKNDPAKIKNMNISKAFGLIKEKKVVFVSRGDNSGTNKKEKLLWQYAGINMPDKEKWYVQTGQGMLATINIAMQKNGYTMTDRGTYIKYQSINANKDILQILVENDKILLNQYSILTLNPKNCPNAKYNLALKFSDWMTSKNTQKLIKEFKLLGKELFIPNAK